MGPSIVSEADLLFNRDCKTRAVDLKGSLGLGTRQSQANDFRTLKHQSSSYSAGPTGCFKVVRENIDAGVTAYGAHRGGVSRGWCLSHAGLCPKYRCARNHRRAKPCEFMGLGDMDVTRPFAYSVW